jgi:hypothetical protein
MDEISHHPAGGHEQSDVDVRSVSKFGIGLCLGLIAAGFLMWFLFDRFARRETANMVKPAVMEAANPQKEPPEPRLEAHPRIDLKDYLAAEDRLVNSYGWVDPEKGIVRIPVSRAMDLMAKEGLK